MIVIAQRNPKRGQRTSQLDFEGMLPQIREQARLAFRSAQPEAREELIQEVIANSFVAFARLLRRGKGDLAYATPLAQYAIRQIRTGRRVGGRLNSHDVSARYVQWAKGIVLERLDRFDAGAGEWQEVLVEARSAGPAETAAARIDVAAWFRSLARKKQRIARRLAQGEATGKVARMFGLTAGRVSQLRRELAESWDRYQGTSARA